MTGLLPDGAAVARAPGRWRGGVHATVRLALAGFALGLTACGEPADPAASPTAAGGSPAEQLTAGAAASGTAPELDYACRIWAPDYAGPMLESQAEDRPYGTLAVRGDRYLLTLEGGGTATGELRVGADLGLAWDGDLGSIDDAPRRVTAARLSAYGNTANLVFDFAPPTDGPVPHRQVICRAAFGG